MIRTTTSFKQRVCLGLLGMALVSAACSDDDDALSEGDAGKGGSSSTAGKSNTGGNSSSGSSAGGSSAAGKTNGGETGVAGKGGSTSTAGTAGAAGTAGTAGTSGNAGEGGGGVGGAGSGGEGGAESGGGAGGADNVGGEGGALGSSGAGGDGPDLVADVLDNPGFEVGTAHAETMPGWTNEGTTGAAYIEYSGPHTGFGRLGHWTTWVDGQSYTARTYQTLDPIPNGTYSFSIWVAREWFETQYLFAKGFNADNLDQEVTKATEDTDSAYVKVTLSGIVVTSGHCTVGVYSAAPTGTYANFDDAEFTLE